MRVSFLAIAVGLAAAALASAAAREPMPLRGAPLPRDSGLQLLVADRRPFVLDVDSGRTRPVAGIPVLEQGVLWVVGLAGGMGVVVAKSTVDARLYAVRRVGRATALGTGRAVAPAADGRSVWIKSRHGSRCALRRVRIDGRRVRAPKPFPCATTIEAGGAVGLVVNSTRLVDPATGRTVRTVPWGVLATAGRTLLLAGPEREFMLLDTTNDAERRLTWPSTLNSLDGRPAVAPDGRLIAVGFADPSWQLTGAQVSDIWLLDAQSGAWSQLPGLPAFVSLKVTSMAWTADNTLVLLGEDGRRSFVAQWRPGQRRLAVKTVRLQRRSSGSDSFAPLE